MLRTYLNAVSLIYFLATLAPTAGADETVRESVLRQLGAASGKVVAGLEGKKVSGYLTRYSHQTGQLVDRQQVALYMSKGLTRLDLTTTESWGNAEATGVRVSYVVNDYHPFIARCLPSSEYTMIGLGEKEVRSQLFANLTPLLSATHVEGQPLDEFLSWENLRCVGANRDNWKGQDCTRFRGEVRRADRQLAWWVHVYYQTGSAAPEVGWRSIGYQFGGRNHWGGKPRLDEYVITYDEAKSHFIPSSVKLFEVTVGDNTTPPLLREQFELESVTDDPKPRSFFTLSEFGLPEPLGMSAPPPFYQRAWFLVLLGGFAVAGGVYYLRRRNRQGASDAA